MRRPGRGLDACCAISANTGRTPKRGDLPARGEAFQRAFALNPDLALAHNLYTYMEVETGRALDAVQRLLGRLSHPHQRSRSVRGAGPGVPLRRPARSVGRRLPPATRLDPAIVTSVAHSFFMLGQYQRAIEVDPDHPPYVSVISFTLRSVSTTKRARWSLPQSTHPGAHPHVELMMQLFEAMLDGRFADGRKCSLN